MLNLEGSTPTEYFDVRCARCQEHVVVEFQGFTGDEGRIDATCPECKASGSFKLKPGKWEGLPSVPEPSTRMPRADYP